MKIAIFAALLLCGCGKPQVHQPQTQFFYRDYPISCDVPKGYEENYCLCDEEGKVHCPAPLKPGESK